MRVLFLSNFYPPNALGGYEQWCQEVGIELVKQGHQVCVLTARASGMAETTIDAGVSVYRQLYLEVEGGLNHTVIRLLKNRKQVETANLKYVRQLVDSFQPDVAVIWGMWNVPRSVPALVEELLPNRVAYYFCDYWPSLPNAYIQRWQEPAKQSLTSLPKQVLGKFFLHRLSKESPITLNLQHPICVSQAVCDLLVQKGVPVQHGKVIYGGTQVESFVKAASEVERVPSNTLRLLYIGRIVPDKGVHTVIKALSHLPEQIRSLVTLDLYGNSEPDYQMMLKEMITQGDLGQQVTFQGSVPRTEIPQILVQYDGLIFSSEWEEPFARTVLEAMAAQLVVIGTTTGGTGEILEEGKTGLTYPAGNSAKLAEQITLLTQNPDLISQLATAGQHCVTSQYTFAHMVNQFEVMLNNLGCETSLTSHSSIQDNIY